MRKYCVTIFFIMTYLAFLIIISYFLYHFSIKPPTLVNIAILFLVAAISMFLANNAVEKEKE